MKAISYFEMKKVAKPVHAVIGTLGKMERLHSMDKDVVGATLELRYALTVITIQQVFDHDLRKLADYANLFQSMLWSTEIHHGKWS